MAMAYRLTMIPKEFYQRVDGILQGFKLSRLKVDPAIWVLKEKDNITGKTVVYGAIGAHVDDFPMKRARNGATFWRSSMGRSNGHHGNARL